MANEWMDQHMTYHPTSMGINAYNRMRGTHSNQQIVAGFNQRGFTAGHLAKNAMAAGAQPNWMNQYTGSEGNIGLSTYNRMKDAGYSVLDIQRDQNASGMSFGSAARDQFNLDLRNHFQPQVEENVVADIPLQNVVADIPSPGTQTGAHNISNNSALGIRTPRPEGWDLNTGGTTAAFRRKKKPKNTANALAINPLTP